MRIRIVKLILLFFVSILLSSCFPLTSNSLKKIHLNDSEKDVTNVLGKPFSKKAHYSKEQLVYYIHDDFFSIFFNLKKFPFIGFYPLLRTGEEYWIVIEEGKVVSFDSASNYRSMGINKSVKDKSSRIDREED